MLLPRVGEIVKVLVAQSYSTLRPHRPWPARLLCPWDSPGKNTRVSSHPLLQGIIPTQGSNLGLLHYRQIPYDLSHQGSSIYCFYYIIFNILHTEFLCQELCNCSLFYKTLLSKKLWHMLE